MLKKLIVTMALVGVTAASYGQGQVNFDTQAVGAKVFAPDGVTPATGAAYFARLYAAAGQNAVRDALAPVGTLVNFRAGGNAGFVQVSGATTSKGVVVNQVVDATTVNGGPVTVQLRAWSSSVDTFDAAVSGGLHYGESGLLSLAATGNPGATPPTTPAELTGLQGFTMVPEPSTIALGILGASALLFARRRK